VKENAMRRRFVTLDVFTDKRFAGNPLAVVLEPDGLDDAAMQTVAREFNFPETVFVFPPADRANRAALRIFTPARELPFAGHPTVGTAVLLGRLDGSDAAIFTLEEKVGRVPCRVRPTGPDSGRAQFDLPRLPEQVGTLGDHAAIAAALSIDPGDIGFARFTPALWSAGNPFACVPLASLDAIRRCRAVEANWNAAFGTDAHNAAFMFCRQTEDGSDFHARMFAPRYGIAEDPATGSAVAAFAGLLAAHGGLGDGDHVVRIEQGYEMGRPSLIELSLSVSGGSVTTAAIGGSAVVVMEGAIEA
jgi:trans-2,3-dihydro-3-hydroxyanthranilate isomerase